MADLKIELTNIEFKNPVMVAAGPPSRNASMIKKCVESGAGGAVSKTISTVAAEIPKPCMAEYKHSFLNTELWSELSPEHWIEKEYKEAKKCGAPLIIGLGYTTKELTELIPKVEKFADAFEISTHYIGRDLTPVINTLKAVRVCTDKPIFAKLSPGIPDIEELGKTLEEIGIDGLVAINSVGPCLKIDIESGLPAMGSKEGYGWMSGAAIRPIALRHIYELAKVVNIPIIGVGGVTSGKDVVEMFMAGASAVQVCTQAIVEGPQAFNRINKELNNWLDEHGYDSIDEIKGITIEKMKKRESANYITNVPKIEKNKCVGCKRCVKSCVYQAISMVDDKAVIDETKCFGCGLCVTRCNTNAITLTNQASQEYSY